MKKDNSGLWNASFGEIGATLKVLQDQGVTLSDFARLRYDIDLAKKVAEIIKSNRKAGESVEVLGDNDIKKIWQKIYKNWFGLQKDFSSLQVPDIYNPEKHFAVIVAQELTMNEVVIAIKKRFNVCLYRDDLDFSATQNDRVSKDCGYIVLFNKNNEADEEFKNLSANQLSKMNHKGITLLERLLLEVLYLDRTKKHLDVNNVTLCSGSRYSDGHVPGVDWGSSSDWLYVRWCYPDYATEYLRSRAVVS